MGVAYVSIGSKEDVSVIQDIEDRLGSISDLICDEEEERKGNMVNTLSHLPPPLPPLPPLPPPSLLPLPYQSHRVHALSTWLTPPPIPLSPSSPPLPPPLIALSIPQGPCVEYMLRHKLLDMLVTTAKTNVRT